MRSPISASRFLLGATLSVAVLTGGVSGNAPVRQWAVTYLTEPTLIVEGEIKRMEF